MADPSKFDPRESPFYSGPELDGLSPDERFDLAKQLRIAARNKRIAMRLGDQRVMRQARVRVWGVILAIATIAGVLALVLQLVTDYAVRPPF